MNKTLFSIILLIVWGVVADFVTVFVLNIAGVPGALVAGRPQKSNKIRYIAGVIISALGQSYVYLAWTAFIVNWTLLARAFQKVSILVWPVAFLTVVLPILFNWARAKREADEDKYTNAQVSALSLTLVATLIVFFVFVFNTQAMKYLYFWVPYMTP